MCDELAVNLPESQRGLSELYHLTIGSPLLEESRALLQKFQGSKMQKTSLFNPD